MLLPMASIWLAMLVRFLHALYSTPTDKMIMTRHTRGAHKAVVAPHGLAHEVAVAHHNGCGDAGLHAAPSQMLDQPGAHTHCEDVTGMLAHGETYNRSCLPASSISWQ